MNLDAHPENAKPATDEIGRLRDQVITQAFVAGQMDAQYTASGHKPDVGPSLKTLKAKAYALALDSIDALIAAVRAESQQRLTTAMRDREAERRQDFAAGFHARPNPLREVWVFTAVDASAEDGCAEAFAAYLKESESK